MAFKYCPTCGKQISDKAPVCPQCGRVFNSKPISDQLPLKTHRPIEDKAATINTPKGNLSPQPSHNIPLPPNGNHNTNKPSKRKSWFWILLGIVVCIGIGVVVWVPLNRHRKQIKEEEQARLEQLRQDSIVALEAELARLEQVRIDSIRQDSIASIQRRLDNAILHWNDFIRSANDGNYYVKGEKSIKKTLQDKDFVQTNHNKEYITDSSWGDFWEESWTYSFFKNKDDRTEKLYEVKVYNIECSVDIKIFDNELLRNLKKEFQSKSFDAYDEWNQIYYEGNTIYINFCGD